MQTVPKNVWAEIQESPEGATAQGDARSQQAVKNASKGEGEELPTPLDP